MKFSKILIIILGVLIALFLLRPLYNAYVINRAFDKAGIETLGKTLRVELKEDSVRDFTFIQNNFELSKWNENERSKFIEHMKNKNLILKPGKYEINQGTKYEKALEIFQFE